MVKRNFEEMGRQKRISGLVLKDGIGKFSDSLFKTDILLSCLNNELTFKISMVKH